MGNGIYFFITRADRFSPPSLRKQRFGNPKPKGIPAFAGMTTHVVLFSLNDLSHHSTSRFVSLILLSQYTQNLLGYQGSWWCYMTSVRLKKETILIENIMPLAQSDKAAVNGQSPGDRGQRLLKIGQDGMPIPGSFVIGGYLQSLRQYQCLVVTQKTIDDLPCLLLAPRR